MRVERFFLFFPPKLVSIKRGETEYGIGAIPLGGFVKITGMNPEELEAAERGRTSSPKPGLLEQLEGADSGSVTPRVDRGPGRSPEMLKRAYYNQPVWKRIVVIGAGPAVNIVLAFVILFFARLRRPRANGLEVDKVEAGTPAAACSSPATGWSPSTASRRAIHDVNSISQREAPAQDRRPREPPISRTRSTATSAPAHRPTAARATTPRQIDRRATARQVAAPADASTTRSETRPRYRLGFRFHLRDADRRTNRRSGGGPGRADACGGHLADGLDGRPDLRCPRSASSSRASVGISERGSTRRSTFEPAQALYVLALISLSLGVINLFPFLPLDGGHIFWSLVEKVRGRRVPFASWSAPAPSASCS